MIMEAMVKDSALAWDAAAFDQFALPEQDMMVLPDHSVTGIEGILAGACLGEVRSPLTCNKASAFTRRVLRQLQIDDADLAEDVCTTFRRFLAKFHREEANLMIEVTNRRVCPQFHCDNLNVRMIKTYFGPTTEYIRRDRPNEVRSAPVGALVFLKGRRHPTHSDLIHHRSPEVPEGSKRLCLIADF